MPDLWFTKNEVISKLIADGCTLKQYYLSIRLSQVNDSLQFNKHYKYDSGRRVLYSEKGYELIKQKFVR